MKNYIEIKTDICTFCECMREGRLFKSIQNQGANVFMCWACAEDFLEELFFGKVG